MATLPKFGILPPDHLVPDLLQPGMTLVFCGTALGQQSALRKAYYANPGNFFWRTLHEIGLTERRLKPEEYPTLATQGIGLTDLCKTAFGNDHELPPDAFDRRALEEKIRTFEPRILAFTSKTGAADFLQKPTGKIAYGFQSETLGATRIYVLSSPSGQARRFWRADSWQELAAVYRRLHAEKNL